MDGNLLQQPRHPFAPAAPGLGARRRTNANVVSENGFKYIVSKNNILGADNKAGVSLMVNMIKNNIEGLYYFFIGEEVGTIGSSCLSKKFDDIDYLKEITSFVKNKFLLISGITPEVWEIFSKAKLIDKITELDSSFTNPTNLLSLNTIKYNKNRYFSKNGL